MSTTEPTQILVVFDLLGIFVFAIAGALVVMLLPVRTSTRWWADHVMRAAEIRLLVGRLNYGDRQRRCERVLRLR